MFYFDVVGIRDVFDDVCCLVGLLFEYGGIFFKNFNGDICFGVG